ncbi:Glutathione S-transferase Delta 2 [Hyalella azteca]|uniref:Glutathione S-transferase D1 n=1 Tax=Hyalella azteca TaxID=294128 RepID=A0A6A0GXK0_HYAAZ|nr:glutathione S-transferase D1 [Hyalella azteca]KAA0191974.1 Glutathione S-transferase Delta 2 [Hyalella azteca]
MSLDLYYCSTIPGCRAVLMVGEALGLTFNLHPLDVHNKEHLRQEFIEVNPLKTVPLLKHEGLVLFESHVICTYLINKFGKDDSLYPKDPASRAKVDQILYFDSGTLYKNLINCLDPKHPKCAYIKARESLSVINRQLGQTPYAAGDQITVADFALVATISTAEAVQPDLSRHPNIVTWLRKCKSVIPGYELHNEPGVQQFAKLYHSKKQKDGSEVNDKNKSGV